MWRRGCLRVRDDGVTLALMWAAAVIDVLLLSATVGGWGVGLQIAALVAMSGPGLFWARRRRWDRFIVQEAGRGLMQVEVLLRQSVEEAPLSEPDTQPEEE